MLDWVPAAFRVLRIRSPKYACRACGKMYQAAAPERPIAVGLATPALLAQVLIAKYCDRLPLYRQAQIFRRHALRSSGRHSLAGSGAHAGGSTRRATNSVPRYLPPTISLPTTRLSRYPIRAGTGQRPIDYGCMLVTIVHGADPLRQRGRSCLNLTAARSGQRRTYTNGIRE
jgi:hypothetical protein